MNKLFFNKKNVSSNGKISFVFSDRATSVSSGTSTLKTTCPETGEIKETVVGTKTAEGGALTFGVYYVRDADTQAVLHDEEHPLVQFFSSLVKNTEVEGLALSEECIIDQRTNEPTTLRWVRHAE